MAARCFVAFADMTDLRVPPEVGIAVSAGDPAARQWIRRLCPGRRVVGVHLLPDEPVRCLVSVTPKAGRA